MKKILVIANGPAHGADEPYNAIRLANALMQRHDAHVTPFLMGDAVSWAIAGHQTPNGHYTLDRMLKSFAHHGGNIARCGTCLDARGLSKKQLIEEAGRSTIDDLAAWIRRSRRRARRLNGQPPRGSHRGRWLLRSLPPSGWRSCVLPAPGVKVPAAVTRSEPSGGFGRPAGNTSQFRRSGARA
jgi:uncharacterized protein involved in oxidation of intracellular sulfur